MSTSDAATNQFGPINRNNESLSHRSDRRRALLKRRLVRAMFVGLLGSGAAMHASKASALTTFQIDPRNGANGFKIAGGANEKLGSSVSGTGDVNGDGFNDYLVGVPYASAGGATNAGGVYVIFGNGASTPGTFDPSTLDGTNGFKVEGDAQSTYLGLRVGRAGDVNGDGYADILIGAPWATAPGVFQGSTFVIFGKPSFSSAVLNVASLDGTNGIRMNGGFFNDFAGEGASGVGDVNDDGRDDIVVGAPGVDVGGVGTPGAAYLLFGQTTFTSATIDLSGLGAPDGLRINGAQDGDEFGYRVAAAGDFDNDRIDDFLITARSSDTNGQNAGTGYLIFGQSSFPAGPLDIASLDATKGMKIEAAGANSNLGVSVSPASDVNGDGISDIIIGAPFADNISGAAYVIFGTATTSASLSVSELNGANGFALTGEEFGATVGQSVAGVGDLDGDGFADVIMGGPNSYQNGQNAGAVYVAFGRDALTTGSYSLSGLDGVEVIKFLGAAESRVGTWVSGLGDFNGDGAPDFAAGAPIANFNSGAAYLVSALPPLPVTKMKVSLNFGVASNDSISLKGFVTVPPGFSPDGKPFTVDVGGAVGSFILGEKASSKTTTGSLKLKIKPPKGSAGPVISPFSLSMKGSFADKLVDEGLDNVTVKAKPVDIDVHVNFANTQYRKLVPQTYSAKQGKSGKTK